MRLRQWEQWQAKEEEPEYEFPEPDLLHDLIRLFFDNINTFIPLLHRPTFEADVENELHHRDSGFARVLLLVCASASRFSADPRVLLPGTEGWSSSGWRWFQQVRITPKSLLVSPKLYDLQVYSVSYRHSLVDKRLTNRIPAWVCVP